MSLFYAEATPMLKTLSDATTKFVSEVRVYIYGLDNVLHSTAGPDIMGNTTSTRPSLASRNKT